MPHRIARTVPRALPIHGFSLDDPDQRMVAHGDGSVVIRMTCFMAGRWDRPVSGETIPRACRMLAGHLPQSRRKAASGFHATMPSLRLSSRVPELSEEPGAQAP